MQVHCSPPQVQAAVRERGARAAEQAAGRARALAAYNRIPRQIFQESGVAVLRRRPVQLRPGVYTVPLLRPEHCRRVTEELDSLRAASLGLSPVSSWPDSDDRQQTHQATDRAFFLAGAWLDSLTAALMARLAPLARRLYPELVGPSGLDSCSAFTVTYSEGGDTELATHDDNSEVSMNLSLTTGHSGGELYLLGEEGDLTLQHRQGWAVLHPGSALHGALALTGGARTNLLLFMRSSSLRGLRCPVCKEPPDLEPVAEGQGDGFLITR
jgi:hypothetical protein